MIRAKSVGARRPVVATVVVALAAVLVVGTGAAGSRADDGDSDEPPSGYFFRSDGAFLGVSTEEETEYAEGGARVTRVVEGSPAAAAGLRAGDIIVRLDGDVIRGPLRLRQRIVERDPGTRVEIVVVRDNRKVTLQAELGDREESFGDVTWSGTPLDEERALELAERSRELAEHYRDWYREHGKELADRQREWQERYAEEWAERYEDWAESLKDLYEGQAEEWAERYRDFEPRRRWGWRFDSSRPRLGVQLIETTPELREHLGGSAGAGVLVSKVLSGTPAERAGVRVGDLILSVDGVEVASPADLIRELREKAGTTVELEVSRDGRRSTLRPELSEADDEPVWGPRASIDARRELRRAMRPALREARAADALRREAARQRDVRRVLRKRPRRIARDGSLRNAV